MKWMGEDDMQATLLIVLGGALGSIASYWLNVWAPPFSRYVPLGTIGINIAGSFIIGFFGTLTLESGRFPAPEPVRLLVMVGFCGGFTTFSSFSLQTLDLIRGGAWPRGLINVVASVLLCLGGAVIDHTIASHLNGDERRVAQNSIEEEAS